MINELGPRLELRIGVGGSYEMTNLLFVAFMFTGSMLFDASFMCTVTTASWKLAKTLKVKNHT